MSIERIARVGMTFQEGLCKELFHGLACFFVGCCYFLFDCVFERYQAWCKWGTGLPFHNVLEYLLSQTENVVFQIHRESVFVAAWEHGSLKYSFVVVEDGVYLFVSGTCKVNGQVCEPVLEPGRLLPCAVVLLAYVEWILGKVVHCFHRINVVVVLRCTPSWCITSSVVVVVLLLLCDGRLLQYPLQPPFHARTWCA